MASGILTIKENIEGNAKKLIGWNIPSDWDFT